MAKIPLKGKASIKACLSTEIDLMITFNFASQHMASAITFAKQAGKIESDNIAERQKTFFTEIRTYVSSAVILSVCALEANINEHFMSNDGILKDYKPDDRLSIFEAIDTPNVKAKYQRRLILNKKQPLQFDKEPFQSFQYLIKFRNALVHYKPETSKELKASRQLEKNLRYKFTTNPYFNQSDPFLGYQSMSYSCAKWAVNTALNFSRAYSEILGITDKFSSYKCL